MFVPPFSRYFSSSEAIALREAATLEALSLPSAYSFCASMMMRVLSLGEAVELGEPRMSYRSDRGWEAMFRSSEKINARENMACEASSKSEGGILDELDGLGDVVTVSGEVTIVMGRIVSRYFVLQIRSQDLRSCERNQ